MRLAPAHSTSDPICSASLRIFGTRKHLHSLQNNSPDCFAYARAFRSSILSEVDTTKKHAMAFCHDVFFDGGGEENRTPVRKPIRQRLSECSLRSTFPHTQVHRQTCMLGSFICHGRLKALPAHVHRKMTPCPRSRSTGAERLPLIRQRKLRYC